MTGSILNAFGVFDSNSHAAKNGVLSLQNWNSGEEKTVKLNGEWDFYPNELITPDPSKDQFRPFSSIRKSIPVPKAWDQYLAKKPTPFGSGTYRLRIKVPKDGRYGIKVNTVRNASKVFINGIEAGAAGVPSKSSQKYQYDFRKYVAFGNSKDKIVEIVVQVANKEYARGGIVQPIDFGKPDQILAKQGLARLIEAFLIAGYLLYSLTYVTVHIQIKHHLYELFFSLFCLAQAVYISTVNERWLFILFPKVHPTEQFDIQMTAMGLMLIFFILFLCTFFHMKITKVLAFLCSTLLFQVILFGIICPTTDIMDYVPLTTMQTLVTTISGICFSYVYVLLFRAFMRKTDEYSYVLIVGLSFISYGILLAIEFFFEVEIGNGTLLMFLVMVSALSLLMKHRYQAALYKAEKLSNELLLQDKLKDDFLAKTSHELSTPLHGIINLSQTLMEGAEGPLRKKQQESLLLIHTVGKRLSKIVEDLLFVSNIKQGRTRLTAKPMNIRVVEEVLTEMVYLIPSSNDLTLINKIPNDLPLIFADEQKLKQVLFNLIYNAIKFTKHGSITITAKPFKDHMSISVTDTGEGIAKEHIKRIFSSFYQVKNDPTYTTDGLGLGLSITKKIVEDSGGQISVTSEVGRGSCFTFTMPLATEEQLQQWKMVVDKNVPNTTPEIENNLTSINHLLSTKVNGTKPYTILLVDDELANLKVLMNMMHSLDYSVIAVDNGQEALDTLKAEKIDLIILDLMMPGMSGYDVCQVIRQTYDLVELPIIMLTAAGRISDLTMSFQMGANDFLQKPIDLEELKVRVESLLLMKQSSNEAIKHELSFYYAQIKPHFLYNTINTIIGLSYIDEEKTRDALHYLAIYFRAKLNFQSHHTLVPLDDELELLKAYLAIEQIRFGDRLKIVYQIDETIDILIPSMTLQPLAENAVQHGIMPRNQGGTLWITIDREQTGVKIVIQDDGVGIPLKKQQELLSGKNKRVGFTNPLNKLSLMKGATFQLESEEGQGTKITIHLPENRHRE